MLQQPHGDGGEQQEVAVESATGDGVEVVDVDFDGVVYELGELVSQRCGGAPAALRQALPSVAHLGSSAGGDGDAAGCRGVT